MQKMCIKCRKIKPLDQFHKATREKDGRQARCAECAIEDNRIRRRNNPRHAKDIQLKSRYGIGLAAIEALIIIQDGLCPACGLDLGDSWCVDHDHSCCPGKRSCGSCVRGILHGPCNRALGIFGESPRQLRLAALYLETAARGGAGRVSVTGSRNVTA